MDVNANKATNWPITTPTTPTSTTPAVNTSPPLEEKKSGGVLGFIGDVFVGGGKAVVDMGKGLINTVMHPIQTIKGLGYVITHPSTLVQAFVNPYMEAIKSGHPGEALGRGIVEVGSLFINPSQVANGVVKGFNAVKGALTGTKTAATVASTTANVAQAARYANSLTNGIAKVESKAAALAKAGHTAEAAKMAAYAQSLASAKAVAAAGDVAGAMGMVKAATKAGEMASTFKLANQVINAGAVATAATTVASKVTSKVPALTKTAANELTKIGITDPGLIDDALKAAKQAYTSTKNLPGLTATQAKVAAANKAAQVLGIEGSSAAAQKIANAVSLHGAAAQAVGQGVTATLSNGTKLTTGIATTTVAAESAGSVASKIAGTTIGDIVTAPITAGKHVIDNIGDAAGKIADTTLGDLVSAPIKAGKHVIDNLGDTASKVAGKVADVVGDIPGKVAGMVGEIPAKVAGAVSAVGAMKVGDILRIPAQLGTLALQHPQIVLAAGMVANRLQNLPTEATQGADALNNLTAEQAAQIAAKYGLDPSLDNVKRFLTEVSEYPGNCVGPDTGAPEDVAQLQNVLKALGYQVTPSGTFDDATALAIVDFKKKHNLHQSYKLTNGDYAVNEYVGQATANAMIEALQNPSTQEVPNTQGASTQAANVDAQNELNSANPVKPATTTVNADGVVMDVLGFDTDAAKADASKADASKADAPKADAAKADAAKADAAKADAAKADAAKADAAKADAAKAAKSYTVKSGDSLSAIAMQVLGDGNRWRELYDLNKGVIGSNPNVIQPGMALKLPS